MPLSGLVSLIFQIYFLIVLARVILSWMSLSKQRGIAASFGLIVYKLTEPLLRPIRNVLRPYQGSIPVDFSPLVLFLLLQVVESLLLRMLVTAGL